MINLAIDGGQSGLRLRVLPDGRTGRGPGYQHGPDSRAATVEAIRAAARDAGVAEQVDTIRGASGARLTEPVDTICLGLTGFPPDAATAAQLARHIARSLPAREVRLTQDMVTAHAGALPGGHGVVVAGGTGLVCLGVGQDGTWRKVDGHGYLFGDAGSAFAIGRAGLVAVQRARDGRGPSTTLTGTGLDPISLYPSPTLVAEVAAFAPEVFRHAPTDAVAQAIVDQAARDIADTIHAALIGPDAVPVALVGGLFEGAGEQLVEPLRAALSPRAQLTPPAGTSLDGAERLATGDLTPYADLVLVHR
ncbi:N-acetylglucosamine kinase [Kribbella italica]|uniref:N-acetylglucosamine kinase-like BadF-type ATPase n=1 Tax=Kribbella italica TaxID=1540520 RepID=A0A7W9JC16_9ACTN|nr:BadF/BadG/BcrA/BcrD ATPase family protein [Kribbella italica]MBB5839376.1 N-acetylglucosamine kinase-like BadF-type ATPase [Kribbella italica]